jgi:hypothetical protein
MGQESRQIVIAAIQRQPRAPPIAVFQPRAEQRALAKSSRCGNQCERTLALLTQAFKQLRTRHPVCWKRGAIEFSAN